MSPKAVKNIHHILPSPSSINESQLHHFASLYPSVVLRAIKRKIRTRAKGKSDSEFDAAVSDFLDLDSFRYDTLPQKLREARNAGKGEKRDGGAGEQVIEMEDLKRLVRWKITRGSFRPTLLPHILSNKPSSLISETTAQAFATYDPSAPSTTYTAALDTLCSLRGVGPATATLVLSVADPQNVPFFADELFAWVRGRQGGNMKYDLREYEWVWEGVKRVRGKGGAGGGGSQKGRNGGALISAETVEKAAFVLGNWAVLTEGERLQAGQNVGRAIDQTDEEHGDKQTKGKESEKEDLEASDVTKAKDSDKKVGLRSLRRQSSDTLTEPALRRSKRAKR